MNASWIFRPYTQLPLNLIIRFSFLNIHRGHFWRILSFRIKRTLPTAQVFSGFRRHELWDIVFWCFLWCSRSESAVSIPGATSLWNHPWKYFENCKNMHANSWSQNPSSCSSSHVSWLHGACIYCLRFEMLRKHTFVLLSCDLQQMYGGRWNATQTTEKTIKTPCDAIRHFKNFGIMRTILACKEILKGLFEHFRDINPWSQITCLPTHYGSTICCSPPTWRKHH